MSSFDNLAKVVVSEAPISSYLKSIGRGVKNVAKTAVNPAAYLKGAANVARGTGSFLSKYSQTSSNALPNALAAGANALDKTAGGLTKAGKWIKDPGTGTDEKRKSVPKKGDTLNVQAKSSTVTGKVVKTVVRDKQTIMIVKFGKKLPIVKKSSAPADGANLIVSDSGGLSIILTQNNKPISANLSASISPTVRDNNWNLYI